MAYWPYEALSRGAASAPTIEQDKTAHKAIDQSIRQLGLEHQIKNLRANVSGWSSNHIAKQFDLVLLDPPYDQIKTELL